MFIEAFSLTHTPTSTTVNDLLDHFNSKISKIIDTIAPVKTKLISGKQKAPWRSAMSVKAMKTECRKAERRWRKSNLRINYDIYKETLHSYNFEIRNARKSFFSEIINNNVNNNARILFATVNRLTNPPAPLPPELLSADKCNEFANFFSDKIKGIRQAINSSISNNYIVLPSNLNSDNVINLTQFEIIDCKTLEETVLNLKPSSCCLDILPTNFFKNVFNCLALELLQIVNNSLQLGIFPEALKTAVIKPLLKTTD